MKANLLILFVVAGLSSPALADGYPFDPESQRVSQPSLRLKLSPTQVREISATGTLTFSDKQLVLLRRHYPAATSRTDVITATFNDNLEGLTEEDVYCFWVAPDEVAVTLNELHPEDQSPFGVVPGSELAANATLAEVAPPHFRLGPDGTVFSQGRQITLEQAFRLIDKMAELSKPKHPVDGADRSLSVVVPPPAAGQGLFSSNNKEKTPKQIFDAIAAYGATKLIEVRRTW